MHLARVLLLAALCLGSIGCGAEDPAGGPGARADAGGLGVDQGGADRRGLDQGGANAADNGAAPAAGPHYFLAIHNEPFHGDPTQQAKLVEAYGVLEELLARADSYGIKLTLMFSPPWSDFIRADPGRVAALARWKAQGHEIAAHHHGIYHGNWDGYAAEDAAQAVATREKLGKSAEPYLGTLSAYMDKLFALDSKVKAGCLNDEADKAALPAAIVHDTCSGLANRGTPGTWESDADTPEKGINDYVTVGTYQGIRRSWLAHYQTTTEVNEKAAEQVFARLTSGVYGSVNHSSPREKSAFLAWLDYLHGRDPQGSRSRTVSQIIEGKLLPEETVTEAQLTKPKPTQPAGGKCGDGTCDALEQANPLLCPQDCP